MPKKNKEKENKEEVKSELTDEELKKLKEDIDEVYLCKKLTKQAEENRRKFDWDWMVRYLFVRGYHFAKYNQGTNSIVFGTRTGVRIPINLVQAHLRGVRNQVTSFQPKWEVLPNVTTETAQENARYSGKTLDYIYVVSQIKRKIKEIVNDALITSIGIWYFDVDRKGNVIVNVIDPYDLYVDPNVKSPNINDPEYGASFITISQQYPIDYVKNNPKFKNTEDIRSDALTASAEYKRFLLQVTKNRQEQSLEDNETTILNRTWRRYTDDKGNLKMKKIYWVKDVEKPLLVEELKDTEYPIEIYQGDIARGELYGESWVKHLIPINRVIDALESHIFEYNHFFAKGRYVIDKNSGVRVIVNQHGQIIEKNRGSNVTSLPISPLPSTPKEQLENMRRYFEDMSGVHDVSLGRLPGTVRSGVAIAELKSADATNQNDLIDNLEDFLSRAGRKILKLVANNWTTSKLISVTGLGGKPEYFMAIGERGNIQDKNKRTYTFGSQEIPLAIIGSENEVRVQVGSWLAYTKEARQEKLKELFRLGAIDQKTYLEYSEFADIDGIMERTRTEQMMQAKASMPSSAVEKQYGVQMTDRELALAENELMTEGVDQPVHPDDNHEIHVSIHREFQKNDLVRAHINEHLKMSRWQMSMMAQSQPPEEGGAGGGEPTPPGQAIGGMPSPNPGGMGAVMPNLAEMMK